MTAETNSDPRHPRRFEKNRNMAAVYPSRRAVTPVVGCATASGYLSAGRVRYRLRLLERWSGALPPPAT